MTRLTWVAARPDGTLLGVGTEPGRFLLWDVADRAVVHAFEAGDFVVRARWTPDGERLLVATFGGPLLVRSGDGRRALGEIPMKHGRVNDLAVDPEGWATCGRDGFVRVWDPATLALRFELVDGRTSCNAVGFMKDFIVAGYEDGYAVGWTRDGKEKVASVLVTDPPVYSLGVSPEGDRVVYGGGKGGMLEMNPGPPREWAPGTRWKGTPPRPIAVNAIQFARDGRFVAAWSDDQARLFRSTKDLFGQGLGTAFYDRSPKPEWVPEFIVSGACFVPKSDFVATSHFDGSLRLWKDGSLAGAWPVADVIPFSLDAVRALCSSPPSRELRDCPICSRIPDDASRFEKGGVVERDTIPPETRRLKCFLDYGPDVGVAHVARCPECGRLYDCEHEYEFLIGGSEDSASFSRTTADEIVKKWFWQNLKGPAALHFEGGAWHVAVGGRTNHRTF